MFLIGRTLSYLVKSASLVGAICVVLMMLHVTADVVGRYLFNAPLPGTTVVVANYYMIIVVFIAIGVAEERQSHIAVDALTDLLPERPRMAFAQFATLVTIVVTVILMISGWTEAVKKTNSGATMEQGSQLFEIWQSYWLIPLGAGLMAAVAAYRFIVTLTGQKSGLDEGTSDVEIINE
ncbi:TRAP transporter small permease [Chachezhania sediminis]|uniref:TRAP transporter small permease n=1 Tax=Chachezhania sediminis TaxID=2599291 RepID=UPI00131CE5C3|nr:TRAP transporter small permease [Chachezhania sediminis]